MEYVVLFSVLAGICLIVAVLAYWVERKPDMPQSGADNLNSQPQQLQLGQNTQDYDTSLTSVPNPESDIKALQTTNSASIQPTPINDLMQDFEFPTHSIEFSTDEKIQALIEHYNPYRGRLSSWWRWGQGEQRAKLLTVLNQEQLLVIQQGAILEEQVQLQKRNIAEFQMWLAQNAAVLHQLQVNEQLINNALAKGRTLETDQELVKEEGLSNLRISEAQQMSDIGVSEHERRTSIDIDARWKQIVQDLDAADLYEISEQQLLRKLRANLTDLHRERYQIEKGKDPPQVKKKILARYDKDIVYLDRLIDARQAGHFSDQDREKVRRLAEGSSDSGADYPPEDDENAV